MFEGSFWIKLWSMAIDQTKELNLEKKGADQVPSGLGFPCVGAGVSGVESFVGYQP